MELAALLNDKATKSKEKTELLSKLVLESKVSADDLLEFAGTAKDPVKATCIEALEYATKQKPELMNEKNFRFVTAALTEKAPRIKWESAKVIGNTAHLFPAHVDQAINNLLDNSEHDGTVVRWSAAFALGEILKLKTKHNKDLLPALEAICNREEKNSIKKIYLDAIKKSK
ncbi:HEAT repeat domain-containing protein [Fluviicola sp.]|uniref:HEAT repeat domain-containing protein n=1 Tax=Fluviicola sp. TaxID=1917219 RepID=UPI0026183E3B|nr:HEAT repeat domain-containing protein [Fluviicola sp.]